MWFSLVYTLQVRRGLNVPEEEALASHLQSGQRLMDVNSTHAAFELAGLWDPCLVSASGSFR